MSVSGVPPGCDPDVWNSLPQEIQSELRQQISPPVSLNNTNTSLDSAPLLGKRPPLFPIFNPNKPSGSARHSDNCSLSSATVVHGSDSALPAADVERWHALMLQHGPGTGNVFNDPDFPATSFSICGKEDSVQENKDSGAAKPPRPAYVLGQVPECFCRALATKRAVKMDTPNKGREYFCCPSRRCKYFQWLDGDMQVPSQSSKRRACTWYCLIALFVSNHFNDFCSDAIFFSSLPGLALAPLCL